MSAIVNYTQRVGDARLSTANTAQALKFLVHFVGDITQPLHDEAYEVGGNDVDVTYQGMFPRCFVLLVFFGGVFFFLPVALKDFVRLMMCAQRLL